jgi:hypothetical protein
VRGTIYILYIHVSNKYINLLRSAQFNMELLYYYYAIFFIPFLARRLIGGYDA